jgi:site-specific recombinase XerD
MLLLACRLGLRASDICGLSFANLFWRENLIVLTQVKTKKHIELPLLAEVGNAIITYLKYGRPVSQLPYVFLHAGNEERRLAEPTLHSIVGSYLQRAGITDVEKKKHGPHALRHSLAGFLLQKKTPLPVISEGHQPIRHVEWRRPAFVSGEVGKTRVAGWGKICWRGTTKPKSS